jgi:1,4-dihydroxy-2-naphthoyl-CoA synthase
VLSADLFAGDEAAEGMAAFAEHRDPSWAVPDRTSERPAS